MSTTVYWIHSPKSWFQRLFGLFSVFETVDGLDKAIYIGTYTDCVKVREIANRAYERGYRDCIDYWNPQA